jgi:hypothetical protein
METSADPGPRYTRTKPTSTGFSWQTRLALSALPLLPLACFMWGGLGIGPLTWFFGGITAMATAWWWPKVWTRSRLPGTPPPAAAVPTPPEPDPDVFSWRPAVESAEDTA